MPAQYRLPTISKMLALATIASHPDLFKIVTSIDVDRVNPALLTAASGTMQSGVRCRIFHVRGRENTVADAFEMRSLSSTFQTFSSSSLNPFSARWGSRDLDVVSSRHPKRDKWTTERLVSELAILTWASIESSAATSYASALRLYTDFCNR
jgi:hypothetical protein